MHIFFLYNCTACTYLSKSLHHTLVHNVNKIIQKSNMMLITKWQLIDGLAEVINYQRCRWPRACRVVLRSHVGYRALHLISSIVVSFIVVVQWVRQVLDGIRCYSSLNITNSDTITIHLNSDTLILLIKRFYGYLILTIIAKKHNR